MSLTRMRLGEYTSLDTVDCGSIAASHRPVSGLHSRSRPSKPSGTGDKLRSRRSYLSSGSGCAVRGSSELGSKDTLRHTASVSEFSSHSGEMEYDMYDYDLDNAMAAPGSMFAPAYWEDGTPTLELELGQLFPESLGEHR